LSFNFNVLVVLNNDIYERLSLNASLMPMV